MGGKEENKIRIYINFNPDLAAYRRNFIVRITNFVNFLIRNIEIITFMSISIAYVKEIYI